MHLMACIGIWRVMSHCSLMTIFTVCNDNQTISMTTEQKPPVDGGYQMYLKHKTLISKCSNAINVLMVFKEL